MRQEQPVGSSRLSSLSLLVGALHGWLLPLDANKTFGSDNNVSSDLDLARGYSSGTLLLRLIDDQTVSTAVLPMDRCRIICISNAIDHLSHRKVGPSSHRNWCNIRLLVTQPSQSIRTAHNAIRLTMAGYMSLYRFGQMYTVILGPSFTVPCSNLHRLHINHPRYRYSVCGVGSWSRESETIG